MLVLWTAGLCECDQVGYVSTIYNAAASLLPPNALLVGWTLLALAKRHMQAMHHRLPRLSVALLHSLYTSPH